MYWLLSILYSKRVHSVLGLFPLLGLTTCYILLCRVFVEGLAYWWVTFPDLNPGISSLKFNTKLQLSTMVGN